MNLVAKMGLCCPRRCVRSMACISAARYNERVGEILSESESESESEINLFQYIRHSRRLSAAAAYLSPDRLYRDITIPLPHPLYPHSLPLILHQQQQQQQHHHQQHHINIPGFHQGSIMKMCDATVRFRATPPAFKEIKST